jgi:DNA-binding beta-propeller fold protein YncE
VVSQGPISADEGTLSVAVTPDGNHAFVSNEYGKATASENEGNIGVVAIARDDGGSFSSATTLLGQIGTGGNAIAGMTLSPDGTRLYVTTEVRAPATVASGEGNPLLSESDCMQQASGPTSANGLLTVIDVATAETSPGPGAILAVVNAGCSPVRMAETADGATLWLSVRGDNRVLAFSTSLLESDPDNALTGYVSSGGTAPVGLHLFHNDQLLAVANSNRFKTGTANGAILDVASAASPSILTTFQTGLFPREVTVGADDATLYVTNFDSDTLQVVTTTVVQ